MFVLLVGCCNQLKPWHHMNSNPWLFIVPWFPWPRFGMGARLGSHGCWAGNRRDGSRWEHPMGPLLMDAAIGQNTQHKKVAKFVLSWTSSPFSPSSFLSFPSFFLSSPSSPSLPSPFRPAFISSLGPFLFLSRSERNTRTWRVRVLGLGELLMAWPDVPNVWQGWHLWEWHHRNAGHITWMHPLRGNLLLLRTTWVCGCLWGQHCSLFALHHLGASRFKWCAAEQGKQLAKE